MQYQQSTILSNINSNNRVLVLSSTRVEIKNNNIKLCIILIINLNIMIRIFVAVVLLNAIALTNTTPIKIQSVHTHDSFQLTLSINPNLTLSIFSIKIAQNPTHLLQLDTHTSKTTFNPPLNSQNVLFNAQHEDRYVIEYYTKSSSNNHNRHFHYLQTEIQGQIQGYLLPSFSQPMRALRVNRLYRCSDTLVSVDWCSGDAYISVFSREERWTLHENIDEGFRSSEREIEYGQAVDEGHSHPIQVDIGDKHHCIISQDTAPARVDFNWKIKQNYQLEDILTITGVSLPVHRKLQNNPTSEQL